MEVQLEFENLKYEVKNKIAFLTFNRPKALNALNSALLTEAYNCLQMIDKDEELRVLVVTGAGDKAFIAGADIAEMSEFTAFDAKKFSELGQSVMDMLQHLSIPVIGAVNGFALGGGSEIALACDFIYASEKAVFGLPEITLGIMPGFGGTQRLARLVGKNMAKELVFTGKKIKADEAKKLGLVNKVVPHQELLNEVMKTAETIASMGQPSLRSAKEVINKGFDVDLTSGCHIEKDAFALCFSSIDSKEGTKAFLEKRTPVFTDGFRSK